MRIVRAVSRMWIDPYYMLTENELWPADDPVVVAHPEWFSTDLEPILHRSTPKPDEPVKRGPGRPRKVEAAVENWDINARTQTPVEAHSE